MLFFGIFGRAADGSLRVGLLGVVVGLTRSREVAKGNTRAGHWLLATVPLGVSGVGSEGTRHFEARCA